MFYNRPLILAVLIRAAGPNAAAMVRRTTDGRMDGWRPLHSACRGGHTECVRLLLSAGAGLDIDLRNPLNMSALGCALFYSSPVRHLLPLLLAAGATIPPEADDLANDQNDDAGYLRKVSGDAAYLRKVAAAGGFPAYEKARRQELATKFAAKAFPRLPTEVAAQVAAFAFHVGYY